MAFFGPNPMTDCIYTGAYVWIKEYNAYAAADIFRAGDALVLRINPEHSWTYTHASYPATHELTLPRRESQFFWPPSNNDTILTVVVPLDAIVRTEHARPPYLPEIH